MDVLLTLAKCVVTCVVSCYVYSSSSARTSSRFNTMEASSVNIRSLCRNDQSFYAYMDFAEDHFIREQLIEFSEFAGLAELLEITGLRHLWTRENLRVIYPRGVRLFYSNRLQVEGHCFFIDTTVMNKPIQMNQFDIGEALAIPSFGQLPTDFIFSNMSSLEPAVLRRMFTGRIPTSYSQVTSVNFTPLAKAVALLVQTNLFPFDPPCITLSLLQCMYAIFSGNRINWSKVIFDRMVDVVPGRYTCVPYPALLTRIFQFFRVPLYSLRSVPITSSLNIRSLENSTMFEV